MKKKTRRYETSETTNKYNVPSNITSIVIIIAIIFFCGIFYDKSITERKKSSANVVVPTATVTDSVENNELRIEGISFEKNENDEVTMFANINRKLDKSDISNSVWLQLRYKIIMKDGQIYNNSVNITMIDDFGGPYNKRNDKCITVKTSDNGYVRNDFKYYNDVSFNADNVRSVKLNLYRHSTYEKDKELIDSYYVCYDD